MKYLRVDKKKERDNIIYFVMKYSKIKSHTHDLKRSLLYLTAKNLIYFDLNLYRDVKY